MSEDPKENQEGPVKYVVGSEFYDLVKNPEVPIAMMIYSSGLENYERKITMWENIAKATN